MPLQQLWRQTGRGRPWIRKGDPPNASWETTGHVCDPVLFARTVVVTSGQFRPLVAEQMTAVCSVVDILLQPVRRDPGPAIAASSATAASRRKAGCKAR